MRKGTTLIEMSMVLAVVAILVLVALPQVGRIRDRVFVRSATTDLLAALTLARHSAIMQGQTVAVHFDTATGRVVVAADTHVVSVHPMHSTYGVSIWTNRDSIAYNPLGLGYGAANFSIRLTRGLAQDTVIVSRLGRARH
ncbi:MAG: GspH/FimT family pseudopilin [Anaerolineae bacterium]|nr:GspH/FimT family pseudopilin [Gemmatimonadaceae bacterium]